MSLINVLPKRFVNWMITSTLNARFDHSLYSMKPEHDFFAQHPTVNDDLPNRIICGAVVVKPNIKRFTKTGVEFEDGSFEDNIDLVLLCTGYKFGFPFIDKSVIDVRDNVVRLYKYVFPPDLTPSTLAVIGCFQPLGALMPLSEQQCRWATRVFKVDEVTYILYSNTIFECLDNSDINDAHVNSKRLCETSYDL